MTQTAPVQTKAALLSALPPINKNCTITNNSSVDIVIIDAYTDKSATTVEQMYEQTLKLLPAASGPVIKAGASGVIVLDDSHTGTDGKPAYNKVYELIIARADNLFPVKSESAVLQFSTQNYAPITVADSDFAAMQTTQQFLQTIMAYPSSTLAKDYSNAMSGAGTTASTAAQIDANVATFFKNTKQYQGVSLNSVVGVNTYYSQFPNVWAAYKPSKSFYLYSSDGATTTYQGEVRLSIPAAVPPTTDKSLPGYGLSYIDPSNTTKKLSYINGQFIDNPNSDNPNICLSGLFTLKSQLTKKTEDNVIIGILSGTANGASVLGYEEKMAKDEKGEWSGMYTLLHPKDLQGWISLFMTAMGVIMGLDFILKGLKSLKDGITKKKSDNDDEDPDATELEEIRSENTVAETEMHTEAQSRMDKINDKVEVPEPEKIGDSMDALKTETTNRLNEDSRGLLDETLTSEGEELQEAAQYSADDKIEEIGDEIETNMEKIEGDTTEELANDVADVETAVSEINTELETEVAAVEAQATQEEQESMEETQQEVKEAEDTSESIDKNAEDAESGETPEEPEFDAEL